MSEEGEFIILNQKRTAKFPRFNFIYIFILFNIVRQLPSNRIVSLVLPLIRCFNHL